MPTFGSARVGPIRYLASLGPPPPAPGVPGDPGLFGPGSEVWRIGRERVLLAGGSAALLLQLAHPLVAAGVAEHSDFSADPLHRLHATLDATLTVAFGDRAQATAAAARVRARHRAVAGQTPAAVGRFPADTDYRAQDPELALWVYATLVWTALEAYDAFVEPLSHARRARYLAQSAPFAELFGVPPELHPGSWTEFERYFRSMDEDGVLEVGPQGRATGREVLAAGAGGLPQPLSSGVRALANVLAAGFLPPRLRAGYGLTWSGGEQRTFAAVRTATRTALPVLPGRVRYWPHYLSARSRLRDPNPRCSGYPARSSSSRRR